MRSRLVEEHREKILELAARHGASNVRVFGSLAEGEGAAGSDLDLLVTLEKERSLLDLVGLKQSSSLTSSHGCSSSGWRSRSASRSWRMRFCQSGRGKMRQVESCFTPLSKMPTKGRSRSRADGSGVSSPASLAMASRMTSDLDWPRRAASRRSVVSVWTSSLTVAISGPLYPAQCSAHWLAGVLIPLERKES